MKSTGKREKDHKSRIESLTMSSLFISFDFVFLCSFTKEFLVILLNAVIKFQYMVEKRFQVRQKIKK